MVTPDRRDLEVSASIAPLRDETGRVNGNGAATRGVPEEKITLRAVQQSEKLTFMGSLLAGVAHELNNPLYILLGRAELLALTAADRQDTRLMEIAGELIQAAHRCSRIVRTFLALARKQPPERQRLSLNNVVSDALALLAHPLRVDGIEVTRALDPALADLWADPHQLHLVVTNLLSNAQQAMREVPGPRHLTVSTRPDATAERVVLEVSDSGLGVAEEFRARIFEPFFTTKPLGQGTGLGLSLCRDIVAAHGGVIRVAPAPRGGAVFTVELPIGVGDEPEGQGHTDEALQSLPSQLVLVVDDDPSVLGLIKDMLTADGHEVETASDGRVALSRLAETEFDVVLADVRMPEHDGRSLHRELERLNPDLVRRMVLLTGDTLSPETTEFLGQTGLPVLFKPFVIDDLRRAVRAASTGARPEE